MKLTILGSGSPEAYIRRASSGYLIETGKDKILFDCGGGVVDNMLRAGLRPSDITHLVFSHLHSDHMMDYARLVHAAWDEGAPPLKVYGPAPIARITQGYFGKDGVMSHDLRARTELVPSQEVWKARGGTLPRPWPAPDVIEITPGFTLKGDGWALTSCQAPHAQPVLECMAFRLETDGASFVYSGDAALSPEMEALIKGADTLLHWCYRLDDVPAHPMMVKMTPTPSQIGRMAKRAGVGQLLLTHFRIQMDGLEDQARAVQILHSDFGSNAEIVEDLNTYQISGPDV